MLDGHDYEKIKDMGFGEHLVLDENDVVVGTYCVHYYDECGECIFCGDVKFNSYLYQQLYGGE